MTCGRIRRAPARVPPTARSQSLVVRWHPSGTRTNSPTIPHDSSAARAHPHAARDHSPSSSPRLQPIRRRPSARRPFPQADSREFSREQPASDVHSRTSADRQSATANPQAASGDRQLASRARSSTHAPCHFRRRTLRFPPTPRLPEATPPRRPMACAAKKEDNAAGYIVVAEAELWPRTPAVRNNTEVAITTKPRNPHFAVGPDSPRADLPRLRQSS